MKKLIEIFLTGNHEQGWLSRIFGGSTLYSDFIDDFSYAQDRADRKKYVYDYVQVPCDTISSPVPHGGLSNALLQWNSMPHNDADILKYVLIPMETLLQKAFLWEKILWMLN